MAAYIQRTDGQLLDPQRVTKRKGEQQKRKRSSLQERVRAREAGGEPRWPDFAGVQGGRRGLAGRCSCPWLDSLNRDDADDDAELHDASAWRGVEAK
jgi:hypothetical protein